MTGWTRAGSLLAVCALLSGCGGPEKAIEEKLSQHVLFLSNFEKGLDALSSKGDPLAELDGANTVFHENGGVTDGYVEFKEGADFMGYRAKDNFPYSRSSFSGAISFWLMGDPSAMESNFPEPFHIGKREDESLPWDNAVIALDFSKPPRQLRLACYTNKAGDRTEAETNAMVEARTIRYDATGWKDGEWHHVVISWKNFNSGSANAEWALYVDGKAVGRKTGLQQDLAWDIDNKRVRFNHYQYTGAVDDIAIFDTSLEAADVAYLYAPKKPINKLLKKDY